ncbi:glycosyltransferase [Massilia sp. GCM10020059]|uniref:Glycosyltransferase n=1 Tax=Massilia agrisoli TaxID=2892444 RepID=A0ABS8ISY3_9BURK|nr:glycosyltransferase [Massilia agrisoli]MCC6071288.1 glycosyltransferase [Massilia agrisoli]
MKSESPLKLRAKTPARLPVMRWQGAIEGVHRGHIYGWAVDTLNPGSRVVLEVYRDDDVIGCVFADIARTDLAEAFGAAAGGPLADTCHGFIADLGSNADELGGVLTVRVANTGIALPENINFSPSNKPPVSATSNVFGDGGLNLHGWAFNGADETRSLVVKAFVGHTQVAETTADLEHPAMRSYAVGKHGFTLNLPLALADGRVHSVRVVDATGHPLNGSPVTVCCFGNGARAVLPDERPPLLDDVVDSYERYLPRSLGMGQYAQWSRMFEPAAAASGQSTLKAGLIVTGDATAQAIEATCASVRAQAGASVQLFSSVAKGRKPTTFSTLLQAALDAGCEVIGCVRAGDTLPPHALATALEGFAEPAAQLVYTDSEHNGQPWFKPAWNPEYALASDYPLDLLLIRSSVLAAYAEQNELPADQASLAWQMLAAVWPQGADAVIHVPRVLYQCNSALGTAEMQARTDAAQRALAIAEPAATLTRSGHADTALFQPRRVQRRLSKRERSKTVSLVIPTRDRVELLERCISTIARHTDWPNLEIIVIDNGSSEAKTKTYFRKIAKSGVRVLPMPGPFNYADLNNRAVDAASGEIIGLINNDIEALHDGWLDELVGQLMRPGVGAVGAKLLWPNGMVQHGGVLLGVGNVAGHFGNRLADADWGDHGRNQLVQRVSGVTAACLLLRKKDFIAVGGMDPVAFPVAFNDVDLCLKLRAAGKAIVWTPHATLLHAESASRGHEDTPQKRARAQRELDQLRQRWGEVLLRDPAYHPSLNLDAHSHAFGGLALPPRDRSPRGGSLPKVKK